MSLMNKKKKEENKQTDSQVDLDFLVHNMPQSGASTASAAPDRRNSQGKGESYKKVGLIIISGGIVMILVLAYFAYRLIFSAADNNANTKGNNNQAANNAASIQNNAENQAPAANDNTAALENQSDNSTATSSADTTGLSGGIASSTAESASSTDDVVVEVATSTPIGAADDSGFPSVQQAIGEDSDSDGLSDISESAFGTNQYLADSDGDSYPDLSEINNGYNPTGAGKIDEGGFISYYYNPTYHYRLIYPKAWGQKNIGGDYFSIFSVPDGSLVQISVQENSRKQDIISWYRQEFSFFDTFDQNRLIRTNDNNQGVYSADGMTVYITDQEKDNIYILSFVPVSDGQVDYFQVFSLMVNSFQTDFQMPADTGKTQE